MLQKRRELKEAGLIKGDGSRRGYRSRNKSVSGRSTTTRKFRSTRALCEVLRHFTGRRAGRDPEFKKRTRRELEGKDKAEQEMKKRKADKRRHKKLLSNNLPMHIDKVSKLNDPRNVHRRAAPCCRLPRLATKSCTRSPR